MSAVACIGLGTMGLGMATRLCAQGAHVTAWNRSAGGRERAEAAGVAVAATPRDAVLDSTAVIVCVADEAALEAVFGGSTGILGALDARHVVLNTSTVRPDHLVDLSRRVAATGARFVDAAMLGNGQHAASGELRFYVGGDAAAVDRARPVLELVAKEVLPVGPVGAGMRRKLLLNVLMGIEMQALAEIALLASAHGIDPADGLDLVSASGFASPVMRFKAPRMAASAFDDADFRLAHMAKDLELATRDIGLDAGRLPMIAAATRTHRSAVDAGLGDLDCAAIAAAVRHQDPSEAEGVRRRPAVAGAGARGFPIPTPTGKAPRQPGVEDAGVRPHHDSSPTGGATQQPHVVDAGVRPDHDSSPTGGATRRPDVAADTGVRVP